MDKNLTQKSGNTIRGATYHGLHTDGSYRIKVNGVAALVQGILFEIMDKGDKRVRRQISKTPGYAEASEATQVFARHSNGNKYKLIGQVTHCTPKSTPELNVQSTVISAPPAANTPDKPVLKPSNTPTVVVSKIETCTDDKPAGMPLALSDAKLVAFKRELEVLNAQRDAGLDPNVSIPSMEIMSQRSHASIYRDVKKKVLPKPTKIGSRSFFPLSVVVAYTAGHIVGGV